MILDDILLSSSHHQRGFQQQQIGTDTETHSHTLCRKSLNESKALLSELRESCGGDRKILRARGDGGHQENKALWVN